LKGQRKQIKELIARKNGRNLLYSASYPKKTMRNNLKK